MPIRFRCAYCNQLMGIAHRKAGSVVRCPTCGGQGKVQQAGLGGMFRMVTTCPHCRGRGSVIVDKCSNCRGSGRVSVRRKLSVKLPAGIHDGQAVRVGSEGEPPPPELSPEGKGIRGDLHVVVPGQRFVNE